MIWLRLILFLAVCLFVQIKLPFQFLGIPLSVELLFVAAICFGIAHGSIAGLFAGLLAGAIQDGASLSPFGLNLISFTLIAAFAGFFRRVLFVQTLPTRLALVLFSTLLLYFFRFIYFSWGWVSVPILPSLVGNLFPMLFWNGATALVFFWLMKICRLTLSVNDDRETSSADRFHHFRRRLAKEGLRWK